MKISFAAPKILDFDIENRPLTYGGGDFTFSEVTAIAASFGAAEPMWYTLLGNHDLLTMLLDFTYLYNRADIVTGHYIRKHDLPHINGALLEYGLPALTPKLTIDTYLDLKPLSGISKSQESLAAMLGVEAPKIQMSQADWRAANRLNRLDLTRARVTGDVRQHQQLRLKLTELGLLNPPQIWSAPK